MEKLLLPFFNAFERKMREALQLLLTLSEHFEELLNLVDIPSIQDTVPGITDDLPSISVTQVTKVLLSG